MTSSSHQYTVRILPWSEASALARPLRETVFVHEQGVSIDEEWDEWDAVSDHAIAFSNTGRAVATTGAAVLAVALDAARLPIAVSSSSSVCACALPFVVCWSSLL
jgi:predicted GNAT family N-acyltransferase